MDPAAQVHFIHRDRLIERVAAVALLHPALIGPLVSAQASHNGAVVRANLVLEAVRISLLVAVAVLGTDFVLVEMSLLEAGDEQFPDAPDALLHGVVTSVP